MSKRAVSFVGCIFELWALPVLGAAAGGACPTKPEAWRFVELLVCSLNPVPCECSQNRETVGHQTGSIAATSFRCRASWHKAHDGQQQVAQQSLVQKVAQESGQQSLQHS